jgi:lysozyme
MISPPMKTSANGRKLIEQFEGLSLKAYDDGTGVWTIGYGHTSAAGLPAVRSGMLIAADEADAILSSDLAAVEADVNHHVTAQINQNQFDALVSFDFNTGALDRSNVLRSVNVGQNAQVSADLMMWDHAGGRVMLGLERRRAAEGKLFNTPVTEVAA